MPTYVSLINWTEQGVRSYQDTVDRADAVSKLADSMGGAQSTFYWTMGPYDIVGITEFPDDETATAFMLNISSQGNVRTTTMRAFDSGQMREIVSKAG